MMWEYIIERISKGQIKGMWTSGVTMLNDYKHVSGYVLNSAGQNHVNRLVSVNDPSPNHFFS